jgi:hypothetical protein
MYVSGKIGVWMLAMCKDCVHNDVCDKYNNVYERELSERYCAECDLFKNKADFVEVKYGHWEEVQGQCFRCSECHRGAIVDIFNRFVLTKHCHNCGAKMDSERRCEE